jgi:Tfp pilus assembly protein PilV
MAKTQDFRSSSGFSLLEAMIALFILTISLLALAQLMIVSLDKTQFSSYDTKAINLAQAKVEELRNLFGWQISSGQVAADLTPGSHGPEEVTIQPPTATLQGQRSFQVSWQVTDLPSGRKSVAISVAPMTTNPRQNETLTLTTDFAP